VDIRLDKAKDYEYNKYMKATLSSTKKRTWRYFSKYIRLRDALKTTGDIHYCKCFTCGMIEPIKNMDAGHFVSRRFNSTLFDEQNVHAQCAHCNVFLSGNQLEYRRQLIKLYGEGIDIELEDKATETKKYTIPELEELIIELKEKIRRMENENN